MPAAARSTLSVFDRWLTRHPLVPPVAAAVAGLALPDIAFAAPWQAGFACAVLAVAAWLAAAGGRLGWSRAAIASSAFALGSCLALPLSSPAEPASVARLAAERPGPATLSGVIVSHPTAAPGLVTFVLETRVARSRGVEGPVSGRLAVAVHGLPEDGVPVATLRHGDDVRLVGELRAPRGFATPGVRSSEDWLRRRGIRAALTVKSMSQVEVLRQGRRPLNWIRSRIIAAIDAHVAFGRHPSSESAAFEVVADDRAAAVLKAMLVDDRGGLDGELVRVLAVAGIIHVLAISGLHVGVLAAFVHVVGRLLGLGERSRLIVALVSAWVYVGVAGAPIPAVRAAILLSMVALARILRRDGSAIDSLLLALLVMVVLEPGGIADAGFQLTFAAVAGIILFAPVVPPTLRPRWLWLGLAASVGAELGIWVVSIFHFGRIAPWGIALNLVAIPVSGLLVVVGLLLPWLALVSGAAADVVGATLRLGVDLLMAVAEPGAAFGSIRVATPPAWLAALTVLAMLATRCPLPRRRWLRSLPAVLLACSLFVPPTREPLDGGLRIHAIDVGQGDAILVELGDRRAMLVDAGGTIRPGNFDVGDRVVVPYLLWLGRREIEVVALTHAHPDHSRGVAAVLRDLDVGALWLGDDPVGDPLVADLRRLAARRGIGVVAARRGLRVPGVEVLHPPAGLSPVTAIANSRSLVMRIRGRGGSALLTGDIHADAEQELTATRLPLAVDILKVAHHGSQTSSTEAFLAAAAPRVALVSCGYDNRFQHPSPAVEERLRRVGSRLLRTDLDGTITVTLMADGELRVTTARIRYRYR